MNSEYSSMFKESSDDNKLPLLKRVEIKRYIHKKSAELNKMYKTDSRLDGSDGKRGSFKAETIDFISKDRHGKSLINVIFAMGQEQYFNFDTKFWKDLGNKMKADLNKIVPIEKVVIGDDIASLCFIYKAE